MRKNNELRVIAHRLLLATSTVAFFAANTSAVVAQEGTNTWLDTITVTGTRTEKSVKESPRSVTVLDAETLEKKSPESVAEMLRDVPGVEILTSSVAGMKRIRIRGESSRRVTILIDGQEVTDHSTYGTPFLVDPSVVERIEVIRGPASVLYGAKAIGGVVNIITKKGGSKPIEAEISGTYFSATKGWQGTGSVFGSLNGFDYRFSGSMDDHGDRELGGTEFDPAGRLQNSSFNNDNLSMHLGYRFGVADNHYISMKAEQHRLSSESWTDPELLVPEVEFDPNSTRIDTSNLTKFDLDLPKRDRKKIGLFYEGTDLNWLVKKVHFDTYYQTVDRIFTQDLGAFAETTVIPGPSPYHTVTTTSNINNRSEDTITNYGGTVQIDLQPLPDHYLIGGVQFLADVLDTKKRSVTDVKVVGTTPIFSTTFQDLHFDTTKTDEAEILTTSIFAQDEWSLGDYWKVTGGLRYYMVKSELKKSNHLTDVDDSEDFKLLKSIGVTFSAIPNTTVRGLYSEGYTHPTLLQLFVPTPFGGGGTTYANPNLMPESSYNLEFGVRYDAQGLLLDAAAYRTVAEDYIARVSCSAALCPTGFDADDDNAQVNADSATTWGFELSAQYNIPGTAFTPYVNGSWTKREIEYETYKTFNTDVPLVSARYGIKYDWNMGNGMRGWADVYARSSAGVKLTEVATHEYIDNTLETEKLDGWTTFNVSLGLNMGEDDKYKLALHLNNLTDKQYQASFNELPAEGRNFVLTARVKF